MSCIKIPDIQNGIPDLVQRIESTLRNSSDPEVSNYMINILHGLGEKYGGNSIYESLYQGMAEEVANNLNLPQQVRKTTYSVAAKKLYNILKESKE